MFKHSLAEKSEEEGQTPPLAAMATRTEYLSLKDEEEVESNPTSFFTWNLNGLGKRLENKDLESKLYSQIDRLQPDVIGLQEVKLPRESDLLKDTVRKGGKDESNWEDFYYAPLKADYDAYLSLSSRKYGGQTVLVKRKLSKPVVTYNLEQKPGHFKSGRVVKLECPALTVTSLYAPFNGLARPDIDQLQRWQDWDKSLMRRELSMATADKPR